MMARLHETSKYSAERQLYTLMDELLAQKSIHATDVLMRMNEIMTGIASKLFNRKFKQISHILCVIYRSLESEQCYCKGITCFTTAEIRAIVTTI